MGCGCAATAAAFFFGCREPATQVDLIRPVQAIRVGDVSAVAGREFPGRAKAKSEVDLSFQVSGPLITLAVDVGQVVKKGDVIAAIDPRDFTSALESAEGNLERAKANLLAMERGARPEEIEALKAGLEKAQAANRQAVEEYERYDKLLKENAVSLSETMVRKARAETTTAEVKRAQEDLNIGMAGARPEDLEAKRSEIRALEAAVTNAKNQLEYATLTAPFDGEVAARYVDNFQTVQAKQPIVRLLDASEIEITVQIPESLIALAPQVKQVAVRFDAIPGREFIGTVTKIGSEASQSTRTYPVTVQIAQPDDARILPGMAATVRNQPSEDEAAGPTALIVPAGAVFTAGADRQTYVWIVDEGSKTVSRRAVTTGDLAPSGLTIASGLERGELVVTSGVNSLNENQEVRLMAEGN
jgi:RND family efflux transporter MFP subunit